MSYYNFSARQGGVTLVELMVAMAISVGLMGALATLVANNSRAYGELSRSSRQIENGRFAMDVLSNEIRLAGFYANVPQGSATYQTPDPCAVTLATLGFSTAPVNIPVAMEGRAGTAADPEPACIADHRNGTTVLIVRRLATETTALASIESSNAYVQTSFCSDDPSVPFVMSDDADDFTLRAADCATTAPIRRYLTRMFYVANCNDCDRDTIPTLKRVDFIDGAMVTTPVAEGIEEIQVEYGFDTDGDGSPDEFLDKRDGVVGSPSNDWSNVMAARIWMISRTAEASPGHEDKKRYDLGFFGVRGPYDDNFKRRAYSQVVRLVNPAGLRE